MSNFFQFCKIEERGASEGILQNRRARGLRRCKKQVSANPSILTQKLKQGMFFHQKNKWNQGVKSNFENLNFWEVPTSRFSLILTKVHQFLKSKVRLHSVFTKQFEFLSKNFFTIVQRNSIFQPSEALSSTVLQNWKKSLGFHGWVPKGKLNFG